MAVERGGQRDERLEVRGGLRILYLRQGRISGGQAFPFSGQEFPDEELLSSFVNLYYDQDSFVPKEVLLPLEPEDGAYYFRALEQKETLDRARDMLRRGDLGGTHAGKFGVDLALEGKDLRNQTRVRRTALRTVLGRTCMEVGGVWIDEGFGAKTPALVVKAQSDAYFKLLEKHPELKEVFRLGNHLVWVAPSGTALVIDAANGKAELSDEELARLFAAKTK